MIRGKKRGPLISIFLFILLIISFFNWLFIMFRNGLYRLRLLPRRRLEVPVISIGNITGGGTGKTPLVRLLARKVQDRGYTPTILSHSRRGSFQGGVGVVSDGHSLLMNAEEAGEETMMLATQLPTVPVVIGQDFWQAGQYAVDELGAEVILLDDGFQQRSLIRNLDLVALDATCPFGHGYLSPRGLLKEPARALRRSDVIVLTKSDYLPQKRRERLLQRLKRLIGQKADIIQASHQPVWLRDFTGNKEKNLSLRKKKVIAFSAIADPGSFEKTLKDLGADLVLRLRFPERHRYNQEELLEIFSMAFLRGAEMIITTEKDVVGLPQELKELIAGQEMGLWVLGIEIEINAGQEKIEEKLDNIIPEEGVPDE